MYPRNAASPEPVAIGAVVQISDGAVQTSGVTVRIKPVGVAEGDGAGTTAYSTDGIVEYTPTQGETDYTSFILIAKKTGCIPVCVTVVTTASATAGHAGVDWGKVANKTTTNALTGTTIADTQKCDLNTIKTQTVTCSGGVTIPAATLASTTNITAGTITTATNVTTVNGLAAGVITAAAIADGAIDAATFAADVDAEILSYLVDDATRIDASALNTLSGHDPGETLGTSTLTQSQVTGGAYALNNASFAFHSSLDLTTTQKASVNAEADTALADYDGPTYTELLNLIRVALRKDAALATDLAALITSVNADLGSGAGAYASTTDSQEAIRDRGDAAWITATGFSTHTAADVWAVATRTLTSAANITSTGGTITVSSGKVTVGTNDDKTGYTITTADKQALIEACFTYDATADYSTADAGSLVKQIADNAGGSSLSVQDIVDGVLDEALSGHTTAGTVAKALSDILDDTGTSGVLLTAAYDDAKTAAQAGDAMTLTSGERDSIAAALLDLADGIETDFTLRMVARLVLASLAGKLSGAATNTVAIRDVNDTKDRITATVDASGNRTAVTLDAS